MVLNLLNSLTPFSIVLKKLKKNLKIIQNLMYFIMVIIIILTLIQDVADEKCQLPGLSSNIQDENSLPDELMMEQLSSLPWKRFGIIPSRPVIAHADMVFLYGILM